MTDETPNGASRSSGLILRGVGAASGVAVGRILHVDAPPSPGAPPGPGSPTAADALAAVADELALLADALRRDGRGEQ
ncbi:MAG: hypothetical protein HOV68_13290, partial [Streptomycetaceae bacterium]|nr:hypothetical protein [Streptomycetaceae bacterium]